uniref:Capsid protein n=1 Tax=Maize streak Reunion virus TaxID=1182518 RepID=I1Z773_9GEMI|nr:capsid protein [Maize streak Reunion virus]
MAGSSRKRTRRGDEVAWNSKRSRLSAQRNASKRVPRNPRVRPSLQIQTITNGSSSMVPVKQPGYCGLLGTYSRGSDENQRHTSETMTYKIALDLHFSITSAAAAYSNSGTGVLWLIYDSQPNGAQPTLKDIFAYEDSLVAWPYTWKVSREVCHRFVVKRRYTFTLESNGRRNDEQPPSNSVWPPCKTHLYFHKFAKGLGVRTEWKNDTAGSVGNIKKGALYIGIAPGNGVEFNVFGKTRLYFKSIGNQ